MLWMHIPCKRGKKLFRVPGMGQPTPVTAHSRRRLNAGFGDNLGTVKGAFRKGSTS